VLGLAVFLVAAPTGYAQSSKSINEQSSSGYQPNQGEPFFLLSDSVVGSQEQARVRLELTQNTAAQEIGGVDIALYRVDKAMDFLKAQKNLHRIVIPSLANEEGLANVLTHLWDTWAKKARLAWQSVFTNQARLAVTTDAPGTKRPVRLFESSTFEQAPRFKTPPGMKAIAQFRYPVTKAQPIQPPQGVKLPGSSSEFKLAAEGNVYIPLGKLAPGLYVVEAALGTHRAVTVVFVSDVVAVTKAAPKQLLVWSVNRVTGAPSPDVKFLWTDGVGVLQSGVSDAKGLASFERPNPEQSYVIGQDAKGGVFITENFYYDSEIYNAKLYAVTDRPLYQPGDTVFVKFLGREFVSARTSKALAGGDIKTTVFDPNGLPIADTRASLSPEAGADTMFRLPQNSGAGGYEIRFSYNENQYAAAFRVSEYQKPHFEMSVVTDKPDFKTGEAVTGKLVLSYPDGSPVKEAVVDLSARAQALTMVDGELDYAGQFPIKLSAGSLKTDASGSAKFSLPPAGVPSRYILSALATDGAAYRVRVSKELLIERAASLWSLRADKQFSAANERVKFVLKPANQDAGTTLSKPSKWEWIRLEDRASASGAISSVAPDTTIDLTLDKPGTYTVTARDEQGNVLGAASHWVSGVGVKPAAGNIDMVSDKQRYAPDELATVLITFPEPVEHALFTLERDAIEKTALLAEKSSWISATKVTPNQWRAQLKVTSDYSPNITLSVAYVKNGEFVFQNQGLAIEQSRINIAIKPSKSSFAPGENATVELVTTIDGKPTAANVTVSVVDEMIYVLQPEIAPNLLDFFYHPRRNNVRTTSTQAFIAYDLASVDTGAQPKRRGAPERAVKLLERPRRENVDTAFWNPSISTDASGKATFNFRVPDSITRWRITARSMNVDGVVGQKTAHVLSDKPFYVKWTSPNWLRSGDAPVASVAIFNNTNVAQEVALIAQGAGLSLNRKFMAKPGPNFVPISFGDIKSDSPDRNTPLNLSISAQGKVVDTLAVALNTRPLGFTRQTSQVLSLSGEVPFKVPANAIDLKVSLMSSSAAQFARVAEDLIDFPFGCVEQTASRMLPLSLALVALRPDQAKMQPMLTQRLATARVRLSFMAGANARFAWWGSHMSDDPFMTVYAYYADWMATQALKQTLPTEHWQRLQEVYSSAGYKSPLAQRALMLHFMNEIGLPTASLNQKLIQDASKALETASPNSAKLAPEDSLPLSDSSNELSSAFALLLGQHNAAASASAVTIDARALAAAQAMVKASSAPLSIALRVLTKTADTGQAEALLRQMAVQSATLDRAIALVWLYKRGDSKAIGEKAQAELQAPWIAQQNLFGQSVYALPYGLPVPASLVVKSPPDAAVSSAESAVLSYQVPETVRGGLAVALIRQLYRLKLDSRTDREQGSVAKSKAANKARTEPTEFTSRSSVFKLIPVTDGEVLSSTDLYLEKIELSSSSKRSLQQGLVQIALPPGASMEPSTWGILVQYPEADAPVALNRAVGEVSQTGYVVPVELVKDTPITVSHLLRFSQKGSYTVPRARFHLMYQPSEVAHEQAKDNGLQRKVIVN
jgi:alpha-2-macroglobulin